MLHINMKLHVVLGILPLVQEFDTREPKMANNTSPIYIKSHTKFEINPSIESQDDSNKISMDV